jgi:hypothetical protein
MILKLFSPKNSAKKIAFFTQNKAQLCRILIITLVFEKNANFFRRKLAKIAENCDHNIEPLVAVVFRAANDPHFLQMKSLVGNKAHVSRVNSADHFLQCLLVDPNHAPNPAKNYVSNFTRICRFSYKYV